ncbi:uncharacterized protein LOC144710963 [Wolffia australiana]
MGGGFAAGLRALAQDGDGGGISAAAAERSQILIRAPPRRMVTLGTCSKLCAFSFFAGALVGFTLKRRLRRWAAKLLRRLKED